MSVKKIFVVLVTIVACVIIGAFTLNILLPNVTTSLVDAAEDMVYNATGMSFDWNGNGNDGATAGTEDAKSNKTDQTNTGAGVQGFQ